MKAVMEHVGQMQKGRWRKWRTQAFLQMDDGLVKPA